MHSIHCTCIHYAYYPSTVHIIQCVCSRSGEGQVCRQSLFVLLSAYWSPPTLCHHIGHPHHHHHHRDHHHHPCQHPCQEYHKQSCLTTCYDHQSWYERCRRDLNKNIVDIGFLTSIIASMHCPNLSSNTIWRKDKKIIRSKSKWIIWADLSIWMGWPT